MTAVDTELDAEQEAGAATGGQVFTTVTGEPLERVLDLTSWLPGEELAKLYLRLEQHVAAAAARETLIREGIRRYVFPQIPRRPSAPPNAGVYRARVADIERVHRGLLFRAQVEACDGASVMHDTLPLTLTQLGISLVNYQGDQGAWAQRLLRRDLRLGDDPVDAAMDALEHRRRETDDARDMLSTLGRRGIMAYAERAALLHHACAPWRMGHGNPLAYELLTGAGMPRLLDHGLDLMRDLVDQGQFVYVPSGGPRWLLTLGDALPPLTYAIVDTLEPWITGRVIEAGHYRGEWGGARLQRLRDFARDTGSRVVVGVYRVAAASPAQIFYAHRESAHLAALIALADSALQEHRGFPMLLDIAAYICTATFDPASFRTTAHMALLEAGIPAAGGYAARIPGGAR